MSSQVTVTRYYGPEGPEEVWRVVSEALGWVAYGPAGEVFAPQPSLVEALEVSGACRFEEGVALHVSETDPFPLLPVLRGWAEAPPGSEQEVSRDIDSGLSFDRSRVILVGDADVAVVSHPDVGSSRFLVVFDESGRLPIALSDTWAEVSTYNGWGNGRQQIGELAPGLIGDISQVDDILTLDIWPRRPDQDERLYEQMVKWAYEKVEFAFSGYDYTLDFCGGRITASFKDEAMEADQDRVDLVSGFFGPTVMRSVQADAAGGAE